MAVVLFLFELAAGYHRVPGVDHDDVVTHLLVRGVVGPVLAAQQGGDLGCHAPDGMAAGIDDIPLAHNVVRIEKLGF